MMSSVDLRCGQSRVSYLRGRRKRAEVERCVLLDALAARQLRRVPSAAQCLDQGSARNETTLAYVDGRLGIGERCLLGDDDARIGDSTGQILVVDDPLGLERGRHGLVLNLGLLSEDAQSSELILDLLERSQHGLPVSGNGFVEDGAGLLDLGTARAGVEYGLHER